MASSAKGAPESKTHPLEFVGPKSSILHSWLEAPEKTDDGTARFRATHCKPLFALVCFGHHGTPLECRVLRSSTVVLGRDEGDLQIVNDPAVSGRHAQLAYRDDMCLVLTDLNSTNGTYFRIRPEQGYRLWDGCNIIIGRQVLTYRSSPPTAPGTRPERARTVAFSSVPKSEAGFGSLIVAQNIATAGGEFPLTSRTVIGRATDRAKITFPEDDFISPVHARVEYNVKLQQAIITDLKSSNGVYVQIRQPVVLEDGDMFRLGEQLFGVVTC